MGERRRVRSLYRVARPYYIWIAALSLNACFVSIDLDKLNDPGDGGMMQGPPDGSTLECPSNTVRALRANPFCIEASEVTNAAYSNFLSAVGAAELAAQPMPCRFNDDFTPS